VIQPGDIYLADLNEEVRRRVLVVSNARFTNASGRALVIPEMVGPVEEVPFPWRIDVEDGNFAIDLLRSVPVERLLEQTGRASFAAMVKVRRAIVHIT
jgi:mRNA-degrading endonuclease toxin of MazEF toxin-antitoxin module